MNLVGEILNGFEKDSMILSVFVDLRKAFHTVSHSLILRKLYKLGIRGNAYSWFSSYLKDRSQCVCINNHMSKPLPVTVGVPQGALLGVLLFQLIINDMFSCLRYCTSILYADDTTLLLVGRSLKFLKLKVQHDSGRLSEWLKMNHLKLNVQKTKCVLFNREALFPRVDLQVDGQIIETVRKYKFLGVTLDQTLSFVDHFNEIYGKLVKSSFIIRFFSRLLSEDTLRTLYFAYYHSHLTYNLNVWWPFLVQSARDGLNILQKRIVRNMCKAHLRQHSMPLMKKHKILTTADKSYVMNCKLVHRIEHKNCSEPIKHLFPTAKHGYSTRNASVNIVNHRTNKFNKSFLCRSITDWQHVKLEVKRVENVKIFTRKVKQALLEKY